jgi:hypothetical protein
MFRRLVLAGLAILAIGTLSTAQAQSRNDSWVLLGTRTVSLLNERDTIDVTPAPGRFKAIRLVAQRRGIDISKVEVLYSDGRVHNEERRINLLPGERTRPIDPRDRGAFIDRVTMFYKTQPGNVVPALIEVYGLQNSADASAKRPSSAPPPSASAPPSAAAAPAVVPAPAAGQASQAKPGQQITGGDVLFGAKSVGFAVDRDVLRVGAEIGKFDRIRLRVIDNDVFINTIKVVYANGDTEDFNVNAEIKKNSRTPWVQLKGDRFIKEIQMQYRSRPGSRDQAYVEVYGQYAEGWLGPQGEGRKYNDGWVLLGAQTAGYTIDRNDVIPVGRNEGGFKRVRVQVRDQAITLFEVRVVYGNGEVDIIPANRTKVDPGSVFGPLDLKGGTRVIQEIRPTYRTRIFQQGGISRGRAWVEFWGQH